MANENNLFNNLKQRGFIYQSTNDKELEKRLNNERLTFYMGIDPTAESLHVGHLFCLRMFKLLQDAGHKGILVIGGATAMVGDPSGKSDIRKVLDNKQVEKNISEVKKFSSKFINTKGENPAIIKNNSEWISKMSYMDFLRNVGMHFPISQMLASDAYAKRLESGGLTFLELGYMPLQAYDFVHLHKNYGCDLQIGGSDQWGNIVAGTMLKRKMDYVNDEENKREVLGLTSPLLTNKDGKKMGKTEKGALWLDQSKVSAFDFFQYFYNVDDADVEKLMKIFTDKPVEKISQMIKDDIILAKKEMAKEITALVHGDKEAEKAVDVADKLFSKKDDFKNADIPAFELSSKLFDEDGLQVTELLTKANITKSKGEARRLIKQGGIYLEEKRLENSEQKIKEADFDDGQIIIRKGKKNYTKIVKI